MEGQACTFFGHRDCPDTVRPALRAAIEELIRNEAVDTFYVGNQGRFDACARVCLRELQKKYPHIRYAVVLAYLPAKRNEHEDMSDTMFPEGQELVHPRYAVVRRNRWLLERADFVIAYVAHSWGGAAKYVREARRRRKNVIDLPLP